MPTMVVQEWVESEAGWGTSFDGYSIHETSADRDDFVKEYWDSLPDGPAPDVHSRPIGEPYLYDVGSDEKLIRQIRKTTNGLRTYKIATW